MLKNTRTVIVDEIHAVASSKRGSHLALSLERLSALCGVAPQRIGLSATQKPIEEVANFLVGAASDRPLIVDSGHFRSRDLQIEVPPSPLEAVMSAEVWDQVYGRIAELIEAHRTTLIFVNTRRMAERVTRQLSDRIGEVRVAAHHGSLAKEKRLDAERRLKCGALSAMVATSSLELGIDIGDVGLVCQLGSPRSTSSRRKRETDWESSLLPRIVSPKAMLSTDSVGSSTTLVSIVQRPSRSSIISAPRIVRLARCLPEIRSCLSASSTKQAACSS
jgi:ATP-dependent Lhr-like helicase